MGKIAPWDEIPESAVVPTDAYLASIESMAEELSQSSGKLMYSTAFKIMEPTAHAGLNLFERFVIGSDEDPEAEDPETWKKSVGARRLKRCLKAAQIPLDQNMDQVMALAIDQVVILMVQEYKEPDVDRAGNPSEYAGQPRNKINAFHPIGTIDPGTKAVDTVAPAPGPAKAKPPLRSTPPAAKPATATTRPAPQTTKTPPKTTPQPKGKIAMFKCGNCNQEFSRAEFPAHVGRCIPAE